MNGLRALSAAMRKALVPAIALLIANIVVTQATRPIGPFKRDGTDDDLRNMAYNFTAALLFQIVLLAFLIVIAALIYMQKRSFDAMRESVVLGPALVALYAAIATCAIMLAIRPPYFVALMFLGLAIIVLTWVCIIVAVIRNLKAG